MNNCSYRFRNLNNGLFQIHSKYRGAYEGTIKSVIKKAHHMGIDKDVLDKAIKQMDEKGHDYADFGILGKLMYTNKGKGQ